MQKLQSVIEASDADLGDELTVKTSNCGHKNKVTVKTSKCGHKNQRRGLGGILNGCGRRNNSHVAKKRANDFDRSTFSDRFSYNKTLGDVSIVKRSTQSTHKPAPSKPIRWAETP